MAEEPESKMYEFFEFQLNFLSVLQVWPKGGVLKPNPWKRLDTYYFMLVLMPNTHAVWNEIFSSIREVDANITELINTLIAFACLVGEHYMVICFINNRTSVKKMCANVYDFQEFTSLDSMIETDRKATLLAKVLSFYCTAGSLYYVTAPLFSGKCERTHTMEKHGIPCILVARVRMLFKFDYTPMHQIVYAHQVFLVFTISWVIVLLTLLLSAMLMQATNHLKTLSSYLQKYSDEDNMVSEKNFNFCVRYHIAIIKYCDDLNEAFGSQMMIHMTLTSFIISTLTFELLMVDVADLVRFGMHLLGWICLLLLICYYGQTLIDESENIAVVAYNSNWHNSSLKVKKDLQQMMMRAQKPIRLNALNLGFMSFATFSKILSSAYSYLTLLVNFK